MSSTKQKPLTTNIGTRIGTLSKGRVIQIPVNESLETEVISFISCLTL